MSEAALLVKDSFKIAVVFGGELPIEITARGPNGFDIVFKMNLMAAASLVEDLERAIKAAK